MAPLQRQSIITMLFVTAGRIESAASLTKLTPDVVHDLGRAFPMLSTPKSARPVDAFTGAKIPRVYSYQVDDQWQQVTFHNDESAPTTISTPFSGDQAATGSLNLDAAKNYYAYEFWSNRLVGKFPGTAKLEESLAAGEVLSHPQVLSTNRHLMQGFIDLANVKWDASHKQISGVAKVVGGEPFRIVLAGNGSKAGKASAQRAKASIEAHPGEGGLEVLVLESPENGDIAWSVTYP